jgi:hypothetical protein
MAMKGLLVPGMVVLAASFAAAGWADGTDEDLATVRHALTARNSQPAGKRETRRHSRRAADRPRMLKIRVEEKGEERVMISVPLALAKSLGDHSIDLGTSEEGNREHLRLWEVLDALEAGQEVVRIDGGEGSVRVWVE